MNNRIRVARTDNLQNVTDADSLNFVLAEGQPFYDAATKMFYIGDGTSTIAQIKADSTKGITSSNVQNTINNVPISDIIESDGSTVKEATNALNVISGGTIASNVTATTQPSTDNSTKVATTGFVNNVLNNQFNLNIKLLYMGNNYYIQSGIGILQPLFLNPKIPLNTPGILTITGYFEDTAGEFTQTTGTNFTCSVYLNNQLTDSKQSVNFSFQCAGAHSVTENTNNARAEFHRCYGTIYANRIEISSLSYFDYDNSGVAGAVVAKESNTQKCYVTSVVFCYR